MRVPSAPGAPSLENTAHAAARDGVSGRTGLFSAFQRLSREGPAGRPCGRGAPCAHPPLQGQGAMCAGIWAQ